MSDIEMNNFIHIKSGCMNSYTIFHVNKLKLYIEGKYKIIPTYETSHCMYLMKFLYSINVFNLNHC